MTTPTKPHESEVQELERVTIHFAGDSGDGMQVTGAQFTRTAAAFGNDISTYPDFPAGAYAVPTAVAQAASFSASRAAIVCLMMFLPGPFLNA